MKVFSMKLWVCHIHLFNQSLWKSAKWSLPTKSRKILPQKFPTIMVVYSHTYYALWQASLSHTYLCDVLQQGHSRYLLLNHTKRLQLTAKLNSCSCMFHLVMWMGGGGEVINKSDFIQYNISSHYCYGCKHWWLLSSRIPRLGLFQWCNISICYHLSIYWEQV